LRRVRVPDGEQTFVFRLEGYEERRETVNVRRHGQRIQVTLERAAFLALEAADRASFGAAVAVDGLPAGRLPARLELPPGRHLVTVSAPGFAPVDEWVALVRGETFTWPVTLGPPTTGQVVVSADLPDAVVWFNGEERGLAPLVLEGVAVGTHEVEIHAPDHAPYATSVVVEPGAQAIVDARIRAGRGDLQVIGNVDGAEVRLDGARAGQLPLTLENLAVGRHVLEVFASGYDPLHETITIEGGMRRVVGVRLEPAVGREAVIARQSVTVTSATAAARVSIEGRALGLVPVTAPRIQTGTYEIEVTAPGHQPYRTRCTVPDGGACERHALLFESPARVAVTSPVAGAALAIDGRDAGPLPYDGGIPVGDRVLSVTAPGFRPWTRVVPIAADSTLDVVAELRSVDERDPGLLLHSGLALPPWVMAADASAGWPHLAEVRFDIGILPFLDAGAALRTNVRLTEIEARARYAWSPVDYFTLGVALRFGGGGGPRDVNTVFLLAEANASLFWQRHLSVTLVQGLDLYSDRYPYAETDADVPAAETGRQNTFAYRLGVALDVSLPAGWSLWGSVEWVAAATHTRRVMGDLWATGREAERVWGRVGVGFTF
jgi:hypothetical protein